LGGNPLAWEARPPKPKSSSAPE
jgi:hypothetical protein